MTLPDPLRVLHLTTSTDAGGSERMLRRTLRALRRRAAPPRVDARVTCIKPLGSLGELLVREGFDVTSLDAPTPKGALALATYPFREMATLLRLRRDVARFRPHVIHAWLPRADLLARFAALGMGSTRVLASVRAAYPDAIPSARLDGLTRGLVTRWLAVSEAAADSHARFSGIPRERFTVIPNGLEEGELEAPPSAEAFRARLALTNGTLLLVTVARLHPQKAIDVLLKALASRTHGAPLHLAVVGEGPQRAELETLARALGIAAHVTFVGRLEDPREALGAADVFVLPSVFEGMPGALLEAMALGRACIATAIPGTLEVAKDGENALLVPPGDPTALALALDALATDPERRARLGEAARAHVRARFRIEDNVERLLRLYDAVLR